ncbi:glycosyltransferase family 4 protein [Polaribacter sp. R77954]|uniref:glycosyltransferase family 4 protein n=1 Tax=Polaribacter sp. R77954 TaxID=3093870 RepID=UPI0037C5B33F
MKIALLAPSDRSFIKEFLPNVNIDHLPLGFSGAPFIGTLIRDFIDFGHTVCAITTTKAINDDYSIKRFTYNNFTWVVVPYRPASIKMNGKKIGRILDFYAYEQNQMLKVLNQGNPDFVHAHWSYEFAGTAVKFKTPYLVTVHDNPFVVLRYFKNLYRFGRLLMAEQILKKVRNASTVSPYMFDYVKKRIENVKVIPNPIKVQYSFTEVKTMIDIKLGSLNAAKIMMVNNGWDQRKNGKKALESFTIIQKKFPNVSLHLFGGGSEKGGLAYKDALDLKVQNVFFNGVVTRDYLLNELKTAHFLLHPALEESFGVVLIEAMSMGVPPIGGDHSGAVPWVINQEKLLVDVRNVQLITEKIVSLIKDKILYRDVSLKGYTNVMERFSSTSIAQQYLSYYSEILNTKSND